jgi:hypothetical protein
MGEFLRVETIIIFVIKIFLLSLSVIIIIFRVITLAGNSSVTKSTSTGMIPGLVSGWQ